MDVPASLADKLKFEGERLFEFLSGLSEADWATEVYAEGATWTVRSILAHLMTAERAFVKLFDQIRQGGAGVSEDFVIDRYNASQQKRTKENSVAQLMADFRSIRATMIEFVAALDPADLEKTGRHPFLGMTTLREMIKMIYIHNQTHYRDVRRALKRGQPTA